MLVIFGVNKPILANFINYLSKSSEKKFKIHYLVKFIFSTNQTSHFAQMSHFIAEVQDILIQRSFKRWIYRLIFKNRLENLLTNYNFIFNQKDKFIDKLVLQIINLNNEMRIFVVVTDSFRVLIYFLD